MDAQIAERLKDQAYAPFARSIGLQLIETNPGTAQTRLAPSPQTSRAENDPTIHPWALIGMADHALSYAFGSIMPPAGGLSTLDIRLDFGPPPAGAVTGHAKVTRLAPHNGTASFSATDETDTPVVAATALFNIRSFPGGSTMRDRPSAPNFEIDHPGPFPALLGLHQDNDQVWLEGGHRRTVGFEGLPALHGGVIGALLAAACESASAGLKMPMRLATLSVRFLRPGGLARLDAQATVIRAGRSAAFATAVCYHTETEPVADAHATFAPSD